VFLENVQDHILGIDFINTHLLGYSSAQQECFWETPPIDSGTLMAIERTYIEALSSKIVKVKCNNNKQKKIDISNQMISTIDTAHTLLTGPAGILKFDNDGIAHTLIQNCGPFAMWIDRNDPLG
jgi:hypothetical protein